MLWFVYVRHSVVKVDFWLDSISKTRPNTQFRNIFIKTKTKELILKNRKNVENISQVIATQHKTQKLQSSRLVLLFVFVLCARPSADLFSHIIFVFVFALLHFAVCAPIFYIPPRIWLALHFFFTSFIRLI